MNTFAPITATVAEIEQVLERLDAENHSLRLQLESARRINDASVQQARDLGALVDTVIVAKDRLQKLCHPSVIDIDVTEFREAEKALEMAQSDLFVAIEDVFLVSAEKLGRAL